MKKTTAFVCSCVAAASLVLLTAIAVGIWTMPARMAARVVAHDDEDA
jgi:hypothetical protein